MLDSRFAAYVVSGDSRQLRDVWRDDHLRVDELAVGVDDSSVLDFHGTDFDEFRAIFRVEAGGFGVEHDVVEQWRLQRRDASWIVASVFVPVAHWVFLCSLRLCGHIQYNREKSDVNKSGSQGFIPACAGQVSFRWLYGMSPRGLSPRVRGRWGRSYTAIALSRFRLIPACAG